MLKWCTIALPTWNRMKPWYIGVYNWRKFRSQTSDSMDRWKSRGGKSQRREQKKRADQRRERVRRKKMQVREKVAKSRFTVFFPMICGSGGSKSSLPEAAGAEPCGQMREEKLHAVVAQSTFPSQNAQSTPGSDHFWKLTCRKSARRCGAKHISKSKGTKHTRFGPLLEVDMSKNCTPLWCEAHFNFKSVKNWRSRTTFGSWHVEKVHAAVAKCKKKWGVKSTYGRLDVVWQGRPKELCMLSIVSRMWGFCSTFNYNHHYTTLHSIPLHSTPFHSNYDYT